MQPAVPQHFSGSNYDHHRDYERLVTQIEAIRELAVGTRKNYRSLTLSTHRKELIDE
jgi:hypothetical protein